MFFCRTFYFSERMPSMLLFCTCTALFYLVKPDCKKWRRKFVSGPPRSYNKHCCAGWLLCSYAQAPTWVVHNSRTMLWLKEKTRRGSTRTQDISLSGSQEKSQKESEAKRSKCLKKYMWDLNGVFFRCNKKGIWNSLFVHHIEYSFSKLYLMQTKRPFYLLVRPEWYHYFMNCQICQQLLTLHS